MEKEILHEARKQVGLYLQVILKQKGWNRAELSRRSSLTREQIKWILEGDRSYTIDSFLKVIRALDCYFYLADRQGKHLDHQDLVEKSDIDKSMDY